MPVGGGKFIAPTGKYFKFSMVTAGRWQGGNMVEEFLMWDKAAFRKQLGLVRNALIAVKDVLDSNQVLSTKKYKKSQNIINFLYFLVLYRSSGFVL